MSPFTVIERIATALPGQDCFTFLIDAVEAKVNFALFNDTLLKVSNKTAEELHREYWEKRNA